MAGGYDKLLPLSPLSLYIQVQCPLPGKIGSQLSNCIRHNALANYSNTNTTMSDIDKGIGYFVENLNKNTNKQALF